MAGASPLLFYIIITLSPIQLSVSLLVLAVAVRAASEERRLRPVVSAGTQE